jgi:hypothetical protein
MPSQGKRPKGAKPPAEDGAAEASPGKRRERDRAVVVTALVVLATMLVLGGLAPSLISMRSTPANILGLLVLAGSLVALALLVDRLVAKLWR